MDPIAQALLSAARVESHGMRLYRLGPDGVYAVEENGNFRFLHSDPWETRPGGWEFGRSIDAPPSLLPPIRPGKIIGIGRNYRAHAEELGNEVPQEPLIFLKAQSSVVGHRAPILMPSMSERVDYEGEIAVIVGRRLVHASEDEARAAIFGITAANDVTARDLQRKDKTFARGKSFDSFCPLGPCVQTAPDWNALEVHTRVNGEQQQHGHVEQMLWSPVELLVYVSRHMTLNPRDVLLTGTPEGVGPLAEGDTVEVEVTGVGILENRTEKDRRG